jgi:alanine-synthesizing transaminase
MVPDASMFSTRTRWEQTPNPLSETWTRRLSSGASAIDLTESNPTRCGFDYPRIIVESLADPRALRYEPVPKGLRSAREAVAQWLSSPARRIPSRPLGVSASTAVDPERIILTASTSEAYAWLFKLLCERGDHVLTPRPSYPLFDFLAGLEEVALIPYALRYRGKRGARRRWRLDMESVTHGADERTRGAIAVHPNNPTGNLLAKDEARALREFCAGRNLALISDEVFLDYPFAEPSALDEPAVGEPAAPLCFGSLAEESPCLSFALGGLSKAAGLPQMKLGWIVVGGPDPLALEAISRLEVIADTYLSVNTPVQWAASALSRYGPEIAEQIRRRVRENRQWIERQASPASSWELLHADGGWYAVLRLPRIYSEEEWCLRLVETEGVLLHPGYFFEFEEEAYLVASLLPQPERLQNAMERVLARIEAGG